MNKHIILIALIGLGNFATAQKWKDKISEAKHKVKSATESIDGANKDYSSEFDTVVFSNMNVFIDKFETGSIKKFTVDNGMLSPIGTPENLEISKSEDGKSIITVHNWKYSPGYEADSEILPCYKHYMGTRMYFKADKFATYYLDSETKKVTIKEIFGGKESMYKLAAEIEAYEKWAESKIKADQETAGANREAKRQADAAARLKKYGLADKDVQSIEIIPEIPEKFGQFIPFSYTLVATLKNGSKITAGNGEGFFEDYIVTTPKRDFNGAIESGFLNSDELVITAKLKKDPSISATKKISIPYNSDIQFQFYGKGWTRSAGENGYNVTVKIKQENHSVTGKPLLRVRIESNASYAPIREFTISPDKSIIIDCHGGDGGGDDSRYYNGGDGGNIRVFKDPSVKSFYIDYDISGGRAGGRSARDGRDGRYIVEEQSVNF
ncbi:MAG: hypothetical protein AB8B72_12085 [Crocinitomicaceae bacterium]